MRELMIAEITYELNRNRDIVLRTYVYAGNKQQERVTYGEYYQHIDKIDDQDLLAFYKSTMIACFRQR